MVTQVDYLQPPRPSGSDRGHLQHTLRLAAPVGRFVAEHVARNRFRLLEIGLPHVARVESLPPHHGDLFDRLLVAQAQEEDLALVSADPVFRRYGVRRIW